MPIADNCTMASSYNLMKEAAGIEIVCANKMRYII
jgi:hypothetical protein